MQLSLVSETWHDFTNHPAVKYPLRIAAAATIATEVDAVYGLIFGDNLFAHLSGLYDKAHASTLLLDNSVQDYESVVRFVALAVLCFVAIPAFFAYEYLDGPVMKKLADNETNIKGER